MSFWPSVVSRGQHYRVAQSTLKVNEMHTTLSEIITIALISTTDCEEIWMYLRIYTWQCNSTYSRRVRSLHRYRLINPLTWRSLVHPENLITCTVNIWTSEQLLAIWRTMSRRQKKSIFEPHELWQIGLHVVFNTTTMSLPWYYVYSSSSNRK